MAFKRPGVYISESLTPLANSIDAGGGSTAAFVGTTKQGGPVLPTFVSSWSQYVSKFGGFGDGSDLLPYSVYEFFNNGGGGTLVVRAVTASAVAATATIKDTQTTPADVLKFTALAPGVWGNSLTVDVVASAGRFDLIFTGKNATERFNDLSLDPADQRSAINVVNSPVSGSALIALTYLGPTPYTTVNAPAATVAKPLITGSEGTGNADLFAAVTQLEIINSPLDINLPGVNASAVLNPIIAWAETRGNVFIVVDGVASTLASDTAAINAIAQGALLSGGASLTLSSVDGVYAPWIVAEDPSSSVPGASRLLPPGGFVLGQYARSDTVKGVQKAPAGTSTTLRGALAPQFRYSTTDLDTLNPIGINVIRTTPGAGLCIWGARTTKVGMPDRYISIRRTLIALKFALTELSRPALFEANDDDLWQFLTSIISQYLQTQWQIGVLKGGSPSAAFYIKCDAENNPPQSADAGTVNIEIGLALTSPAEFIVFNISQSLSGAQAL